MIPTVIVLFGAIYSWITLSDIEAHDPNRMVVDVYSQQYEWHFNYPEQGVTSRELHVPVDRQIEFRMHSLDVIHSFWVPEWRIKKDNVPGITTRAYVTPTKAEDLTLVCTELCGFGHATMRAPVVVEPSQAAFDQWAAAASRRFRTATRSPERRHRRGSSNERQEDYDDRGDGRMAGMTAALFKRPGWWRALTYTILAGAFGLALVVRASQDLRAAGLPD